MKKATALSLLFFAALLFSFSTHAQLKLPGIANGDVRQALEKVITDFPKDFVSLRGEIVNDGPQSVEYASLLSFKTAEKNTITKYSGNQPVFSWQAQMITTEDFTVAEKKYKSLYKDLKAVSLTLNHDYNYGLDGKYDTPDESRKFASTIFHLTPNASNLPNVKVELSMQYEFPEWKVYLMVYQRERDDEERGKTEED